MVQRRNVHSADFVKAPKAEETGTGMKVAAGAFAAYLAYKVRNAMQPVEDAVNLASPMLPCQARRSCISLSGLSH